MRAKELFIKDSGGMSRKFCSMVLQGHVTTECFDYGKDAERAFQFIDHDTVELQNDLIILLDTFGPREFEGYKLSIDFLIGDAPETLHCIPDEIRSSRGSCLIKVSDSIYLTVYIESLD